MKWELAALAAGAVLGFAIGAYFGEDILRFALERLHVIGGLVT